jgi:hypothetical protein
MVIWLIPFSKYYVFNASGANAVPQYVDVTRVFLELCNPALSW